MTEGENTIRVWELCKPLGAEKVIWLWKKGQIARGDLKFYLLRALTPENTEAFSKIVKPDVLAELVDAIDEAPITEEGWGKMRRFAMGGYTGPLTAEVDEAEQQKAEWEMRQYRKGVELLRSFRFCLFPVESTLADPSWLSSTAVAIAAGIYHDTAFDRLPILADALQDAGCENEDILNHLRGEGPHVRGCWALDLVLSKS